MKQIILTLSLISLSPFAYAEQNQTVVQTSESQKPLCEQRIHKDDYGSEFFHRSGEQITQVPDHPEYVFSALGNFLGGTACAFVDSVSDPERTGKNIDRGLGSAVAVTGKALKKGAKAAQEAVHTGAGWVAEKTDEGSKSASEASKAN